MNVQQIGGPYTYGFVSTGERGVDEGMPLAISSYFWENGEIEVSNTNAVIGDRANRLAWEPNEGRLRTRRAPHSNTQVKNRLQALCAMAGTVSLKESYISKEIGIQPSQAHSGTARRCALSARPHPSPHLFLDTCSMIVKYQCAYVYRRGAGLEGPASGRKRRDDISVSSMSTPLMNIIG